MNAAAEAWRRACAERTPAAGLSGTDRRSRL